MLVPVKNSRAAKIDESDWDVVKNYRWYRHSEGYAVACTGRYGRDFVYMHRLILAVDAGRQVDHRNRDKLDNRRLNLRAASLSQQRRNQSKRAGTSSQFKGVCWDKGRQKWKATLGIRTAGILKNYNLGRFGNELEAAAAYNAAAIEHFGEFAAVNKIPC